MERETWATGESEKHEKRALFLHFSGSIPDSGAGDRAGSNVGHVFLVISNLLHRNRDLEKNNKRQIEVRIKHSHGRIAYLFLDLFSGCDALINES